MITEIFKDYSEKIHKKIDSDKISVHDINNLVVLLNWSFKLKNDFFIPQFNSNLITSIKRFYNQLKTNILFNDCYDIFENITKDQLKTIRFMINQYTLNYNLLKINSPKLNEKFRNDELMKLTECVSLESSKNLFQYITIYINQTIDKKLDVAMNNTK